ncbi:MAG: decaprenyl-phosphate phosphoribosyltransferase [bacterium]|nr:decaprenyl-phosphate phosphoribosyltransferase [bacterium]
MPTLRAFLENLRPRQWTKNLLLFAGVIFGQRLGEAGCVARAAVGALVFCLASGAIYVFNDIADRDLDARHPYKKLRPIPSGRLPVATAVRAGTALVAVVLAAAFLLGPRFGMVVAVFFAWNWLYTQVLKGIPILDVTGIGMSFVIRAVAGVLVLEPTCPDVTISPWLLLCTLFLSFFLGFAKRRDEFLKILPEGGDTRPVLRGYTEAMLNALIGISFGLTSMAYALYTVWPDTVAHFGTRDLVYTLPFVLAGMGRYLYLVYHEGRGGRPHEILLNDSVLQVIVLGWIIAAVRIIGATP